MRDFLENIFGDELPPDLRIVVFTTPAHRWQFFTDTIALRQYALAQAASQNIYFGLGLIQGTPQGRGKYEDIGGIGALWCDVDVHGPAHARTNLPASLEEAKALVERMPLPPSILVDSGHGLHAYWLLKEPWIFESEAERQAAQSLARRWHGQVCNLAAAQGWALENLGDLTRVLRLPDTLNHNGGGEPAMVRVIESHSDRRYVADDFEEFLLPDEASTPSAAEAGSNLTSALVLNPDVEPPALKLLELASTSPLFWDTWNHNRADLADSSQSGYDLSLAMIAALSGWSDQEIANLVIAARRKHNENPQKALRENYIRRTIEKARQSIVTTSQEGVDLSGMLGKFGIVEPMPVDTDTPSDPGVIPEELLRIPGFISEVMDLCLESAPYPCPSMTFCGALALQAFLAGRKVRDPGDNRTNLYLLGLAHSSVGKDWIRKLNAKILHDIGLASCLGDRLASGEGIQDALFPKPCMLFQTDEIDGMLQSINKAKDARHEGIMATLLSLYSSANSVFAMRPKAGNPDPGVIEQPNLVLFGTAIPNHYYEALSERMLTNGFFARMIIIEAGRRCKGREPRILRVSERAIATAKWWSDFRPGAGNLQDWYPMPAIVEQTAAAQQLLVEVREEAEAEYAEAEQRSDPVGTTVWGRVSEQTRKLALLYAISENHLSPRIDAAAVRWASQLMMHQTRRMLFMAHQHVAENPFHATCLKLLKKLRAAPDRQLPHQVLLKRMKLDAKHFRELTSTLIERGDVIPVPMQTAGRTGMIYRLSESEERVKEEKEALKIEHLVVKEEEVR